MKPYSIDVEIRFLDEFRDADPQVINFKDETEKQLFLRTIEFAMHKEIMLQELYKKRIEPYSEAIVLAPYVKIKNPFFRLIEQDNIVICDIILTKEKNLRLEIFVRSRQTHTNKIVFKVEQFVDTVFESVRSKILRLPEIKEALKGIYNNEEVI